MVGNATIVYIFFAYVKYESSMKTYQTQLLNFSGYLLNKCRPKYLKEMFIASFLSEHTVHS